MKRTKLGFTLMELLIIVAIISVLIAVVIPLFSWQQDKAKEATCAANRRSLKVEVIAGYLSGDYGSCQKAFDALYDKEKYSCPSGGAYNWVSIGDSGRVECTIHGDGGEPGGDSGDEGLDTITLTDSSGNKHTLHSSLDWVEIQQKLIEGWNVIPGCVLSDNSGMYVCCSWANEWIKYNNVEDMTVADLAAKLPDYFIKVDSTSKIRTADDRMENNGSMVWESEPRKGDLCYYEGKFYVAPTDINKWTMPRGGWIEVEQ